MIDDILGRLEKVRRHSNYFTARCPAHPDRNPSLSIRDMGDRIAVKCFSGCTTDQITAALNLQPGDLHADPDTEPKILDTYPYVGADGEPLFEVVRYVPKAFKQRRMKDGDWVWNLTGITRVPYRLPELREAIEAGRQVFLVEGEKDVHRLEAEGLVATTTPGGAANWTDTYSEWFTGGTVNIIPDNDPAGEEYAAAAAEDVGRVAREVRIIRLPDLKPSGDVNDWLYTHTRQDLEEAARTAAPWQGGGQVPHTTLGSDSVIMEWPDSDVTATITRLTWQAGHVHGEVTVEWSGQTLVEYQRVNTQSASARSALVTELNRYDKTIEWYRILARLFGEAVRRYRTVGRLVDMRDQPKAEPPRFLIGDYWPDMARPSLLFGDGESAKSIISLALLLSLASGRPLIAGADPYQTGPVAYLDYEDDEDAFNYRLQLMAATNGIDLLACQTIYYHRPGTHLIQTADTLADQLADHGVIAAVVDSRAGAQSGSLVNDDDTRTFVDAVIQLGVRAWVIDHLDKESAKRTRAAKHSFGSVFLRNRMASSWFVKANNKTATQTTVTLTDAKWNHGPTRPARTLIVDWTEGLRIDRRGLIVEYEETGDTVRDRLAALLDEAGSLSSRELADSTGDKLDTIRKTLKRDKAMFAQVGEYDLWMLAPDPL